MNKYTDEIINAARTIAEYCRRHVCYQCPLNIGDKTDSILGAHCVCDYDVIHLPSAWKIEELKEDTKRD